MDQRAQSPGHPLWTPVAGTPGASAAPGNEISPRLLSAVLGLGGVLLGVCQVMIVPLLPDLPRLTGASASDVSWLVTVTLLVGAVATPLFGRAGDMFGKRRMLLIALGLLSVGSVLCALTSNIWLLIPGRGLQGACLAVVPLSISILRDELPPARVGSAVAMMSATVGIGAALGVPFAALIVHVADWHMMFWAVAGLGLADLVLARLLVRESTVRTPARFDAIGAAGLAAGLLCLLISLSKAADWGWGSARFLGLAGTAVIVFAGWGRWQMRAVDPLVDLRLARRPAVLWPNLAAVLIGFAFYANSLSTAQLVQVPTETGYGLGESMLVGGLCLLPGGLCMVLLSPVSARITAARGPKATLVLGALVMILGYAVRIFTSRDLTLIILGATVVSAGTALAYSAMPMLIMRAVPRTQTAAANGLNVLLRTVGQAMCSTVVAAVLTHVTVSTSRGPVPGLHAFLIVFAVAGVVAAVAALVTGLIPGPRPTAAEGRAPAPRAEADAEADNGRAGAAGAAVPEPAFATGPDRVVPAGHRERDHVFSVPPEALVPATLVESSVRATSPEQERRIG